MRLVLSSAVASGLEQIGDFIAQDNPRQAIRVLRQLHIRMKRIARQPKLFRLRPEIAPEVRLATLDKYVILFRIRKDSVRIERVLHGGRDLIALLSDHLDGQ